VTLSCGDKRAESSRGSFAGAADPTDLPVIIADRDADGVSMFPRKVEETSANASLMRAPGEKQRNKLEARGVRAILRVPFVAGEFCCESRSPRKPNFELHAAAELFAQMFALRLELDQTKNG
jgi:hypothetical protein